MTLCINCKHWQGDRNIDPELPLKPPRDEWRDGVCGELRYELEFETYGDVGQIEKILTVASFGCVFGEEVKKDNQKEE